MKLTKAQRHAAYKKALISAKTGEYPISVCIWLHKAANLPNTIAWVDTPEYFPEFENKKPEGAGLYTPWWYHEDLKIRQSVLRACIRETAPKRKVKK